MVTAPGEEAQVDYGSGPMVRDPQSGKYRRTRLFVLTLGTGHTQVPKGFAEETLRITEGVHVRGVVQIHPCLESFRHQCVALS